jgi:hypothetical protein
MCHSVTDVTLWYLCNFCEETYLRWACRLNSLWNDIFNPPGGNPTVHINTQTIPRTTENIQHIGQHKNNRTTKKYVEQHKYMEQCGPCPVFAGFILAFALQLRKKHGKTSVAVVIHKHTIRIYSCRSQRSRGLRRSSAEIVGSNSTGGMDVLLSGRGLCNWLITRPEESYRLLGVVVCELETSRMRKQWHALGGREGKKLH